MKLACLIFLILFAFGERGYTQCGKNINLTGSKTIYLDRNGLVIRTEEENSFVHIAKSMVTISIRDEFKATCTIKSSDCSWTVPFIKGRTTIQAGITNDIGEAKDIVLSIEGTEEGLFLLFEITDSPGDKVKVILDKFEEAV